MLFLGVLRGLVGDDELLRAFDVPHDYLVGKLPMYFFNLFDISVADDEIGHVHLDFL